MSNLNTNLNFSDSNFSSDRKILLFDLDFTGHHAGYIQNLVRYWREQQLPGSLNVLVSPKFIELHSDVVDIALTCSLRKINFIAISLEEEAMLKSKESSFSRAFRAFQEWNLLCKYVSLLEATHCLLMYFDALLLPLALVKNCPCPLSGIYFRPVFHYSKFLSFTPSVRERFWQMRDRFLLSRIFHSHFQTLFCLDPFELFELLKENDLGLANPPLIDRNYVPAKLISYTQENFYNTGVILYKKSAKTEKFFSKWTEKVMLQDDSNMRAGYFCDQYYFNKLIEENCHLDCGLKLTVLINKIYNVRPPMIQPLKKAGEIENVKILHCHNLHKSFLARQYLRLRQRISRDLRGKFKF